MFAIQSNIYVCYVMEYRKFQTELRSEGQCNAYMFGMFLQKNSCIR